MIHCEERESKRSWLIQRYYPSICPEGLKKLSNIFVSGSFRSRGLPNTVGQPTMLGVYVKCQNQRSYDITNCLTCPHRYRHSATWHGSSYTPLIHSIPLLHRFPQQCFIRLLQQGKGSQHSSVQSREWSLVNAMELLSYVHTSYLVSLKFNFEVWNIHKFRLRGDFLWNTNINNSISNFNLSLVSMSRSPSTNITHPCGCCCSRFWRCVDLQVDTNVSEKHTVSIFRAETQHHKPEQQHPHGRKDLKSHLSLSMFFWTCTQHIPTFRWNILYPSSGSMFIRKLGSLSTPKINIHISTAVRAKLS
jgi:hypothetical protein